MDLKKNYAEVLIDGKIYTIGGAEDISYIQRVADHVNRKQMELRSQPGFLKQKDDYQIVMLQINLADDYFKAREMAELLKRQKEETERDIYGIKHELINTQMKLEEAQARILELESALQDKERRTRQSSRRASGQNIGPTIWQGTDSVARQISEPEVGLSLMQSAATASEPEFLKGEALAEDMETVQEDKHWDKDEMEKQKAIQAAKAATERLLSDRTAQQSRGRQTRR